MTVPEIINELRSIEASASVLAERAEKLRRKLEPVTGSSPKKGSLTDEERARIRAKRKKTMLRNVQ